ncbi:MAG: deoxyribonuclease IV [Actinomycetota bacterium]
MRFGAHVRRGSKATTGVVRECRLRGADCAQVFLSNPRAWASPRQTDEQVAAFREAWAASGLGPLIAHAPYLVNIASADPVFLGKSRALAIASIEACDALGADALVVHAGNGGGGDTHLARRRAVASIDAVTEASERTRVLVELMAGTRGAVASTAAEAAELLGRVAVDAVGLCLDTCHLFAAGYGLDTAEGVAALFDELRTEGLTGRIGLMHANDSEYGRGEHRDRHAPIGEGRIGSDGFGSLLARPEVADLAFVLETPGEASDHAEQIARLRALRPKPARGPR